MKRKKLVLVSITLIALVFILDRFIWMPERIKQLWVHESGRNLGDPIAYDQSFELNGSRIIFKEYEQKESFPEIDRNRKSNFYLLGCYFESLYIYDTIRNEIIIYSDK